MYLKWSKDNMKLKKTFTISFGLPAVEACPQAGMCASVCYATQGTYNIPVVRRARAFNFRQAKQANFRYKLCADFYHLWNYGKGVTSIRIHDSGDFFSQRYLDDWFYGIRKFPGVQFYCYTKSLHLDWRGKPNNLTVVQSCGGKLDHLIDLELPHSRIFATHEDRIKAGYVDGNINDGPAQNGEIKIGLVYHGNKHLTDNQTRYFGV